MQVAAKVVEGDAGERIVTPFDVVTVRVPSGSARVLMVTVGAPYAPFARELAEAAARGAGVEEIVAVAGRHGVTLADVPPAEAPTPPAASADEIVAEYAAAWGRGAPEEAWAYYADDVVMRLPGRSALAGVHQGRAAVVAALDAFLARTDGAPPEVHVVDRLVSGERVALVLREAVTREDRRLELRRTNVYRVVDGRIAEIDVYEADQYEVDAFFA